MIISLAEPGRTLWHVGGLDGYLRLACRVASLATIGAALGSLVESDIVMRDATTRSHEDGRTAADV